MSVSTSASDIKTMKLYSHLERINSELLDLGIDEDSPLNVEDLSPFDNLHYHGTDAVLRAINELGLTAESRVLEIGSGLGGPARFMAEQTGCHVTALELQDDMNVLAMDLTARCGLGAKIDHVCGDALDAPLESSAYDAVVSWLAIYHIPNHEALFTRIADTLKPSGVIYVEDLTGRRVFSEAEADIYRTKLYGNTSPSLNEYYSTLDQAGFTEIQLMDQSDDWAAFTNSRLDTYRIGKDRHSKIHGAEACAALEDFYVAVDHLFQTGCLGGVTATARIIK